MAKFEIEKKPSQMGLGELIFALVTLKDDLEDCMVDENLYPYPEEYAEYGGVMEYNKQVVEAYTEFQYALIDELDELGLVYEFGRETR